MTRPYIMIGAGGTGAALFPFLYRYLASYYQDRDETYTLSIIDGKEVHASKLNRQLFSGRFAGNPKVTALLEQYAADPSVVIAVPRYLDDTNIHGIRENSVVLIAADNFPVRARIEAHAQTLDNIAIINGGNEMHDGSLQIYVRRNGTDVTPPLSQGHPEILRDDPYDPVGKSCEELAELPSGEQTIIANMMSATVMLNAVRRLHDWENRQTDIVYGEEVWFDLNTFAMRPTTRPEPAP